MKRKTIFYLSSSFIMAGPVLIGFGTGLLVSKTWPCLYIGLGAGLISTALFGIKTLKRLIINNQDSI
jgi:hypothetical protein